MSRFLTRVSFGIIFALATTIGFSSDAARKLKVPCQQLSAPAYLSVEPLPNQTQVEVSDIEVIRFLQLNVGALYQLAGKYERKEPNKLTPIEGAGPKEVDERQRQQIQDMIDRVGPGIIGMQEVDPGALDRFIPDYLESRFLGLESETNETGRKIRIGTLTDRNFPFEIATRSYVDRLWQDPMDRNSWQKVFSRDAFVNIIRVKGAKRPFLIDITNHLKSMRHRGEGASFDENSKTLHAAQVKELANIIRELRAEFGPDVGIIVSGDMNREVRDVENFKELIELGFRDVLDIANVPHDQRITQMTIIDGKPRYSQLDGAFASENLWGLIESPQVERWYDNDGVLMPLAETFGQRELQGSDHFGLSWIVRVGPLIEASLK